MENNSAMLSGETRESLIVSRSLWIKKRDDIFSQMEDEKENESLNSNLKEYLSELDEKVDDIDLMLSMPCGFSEENINSENDPQNIDMLAEGWDLTELESERDFLDSNYQGLSSFFPGCDEFSGRFNETFSIRISA